MYQWESKRIGPAPHDREPISPHSRTQRAVERVRQFLQGTAQQASLFVPDQLAVALAVPLGDGPDEADRCFALGWLHWLGGRYDEAEPLLLRSLQLPTGTVDWLLAAYWAGRVGLLVGQRAGFEAFEQQLRKVREVPHAICWFVDLLWRAGQGNRAEQVWKSLRGNPRLKTSDEALLTEARWLICQADWSAVATLLGDRRPASPILNVERMLLLAWVQAQRGRLADARVLLQEVRTSCYPMRGYQLTSRLLEGRATGAVTFADLLALTETSLSRNFVAGQQARFHGEVDQAVSHMQTARASLRLAPFADYALSRLLPEWSQPSSVEWANAFLEPRLSWWQEVRRFSERTTSPEDLLAALHRVRLAEYPAPGREELERLARTLLASGASIWPANPDRNLRRALIESLATNLSPEEAWGRLLRAARETDDDDPLANRYLGHALLRLMLLRQGQRLPTTLSEALEQAARLLGSSPLPQLVAELVDPPTTEPLSLSRIREWVQQTLACCGEATPDSPGLTGLLARSLQALEAALAEKGPELREWLRPDPVWTRVEQPPAFLVHALQTSSHAGLAPGDWTALVHDWLEQWPAERLNAQARILGIRVGLFAARLELANTPHGVDPVSWALHQVSESIRSQDPRTARNWLHRAVLAQGAKPFPADLARLLQQALPELERYSQAQWLAELACLTADQMPEPAAHFVDLRDLLFALPAGRALIALARLEDRETARQHLLELIEHDPLPPRLLHHMALIVQRAALVCEQHLREEESLRWWKLCWRLWLRCALALPPTEREGVNLLIEQLLDQHRLRLSSQLQRREMESARRIWQFVLGLPQLPGLTDDQVIRLRDGVAHFREQLATAILLEGRDVLHHGAAPEGWRGDYEGGLGILRLLLSLDRENRRLLTAVVEISVDWFLDLYDTNQPRRLQTEVERYTPFALQLSRALGRQDSSETTDLSASVALSEFCKFRGFVAPTRQRKRELYEEALRWNPANENVHRLLAELEEGT